MEIEIREEIIRRVVVAPQSRIDAFTVPKLRAKLDLLLEEGVIYFVIDLSKTPFLDSAGMAVLVSLLKRVRLAGGDVKLVWPQEEGARRIILLTKFDRVFDMSETADEALTQF